MTSVEAESSIERTQPEVEAMESKTELPQSKKTMDWLVQQTRNAAIIYGARIINVACCETRDGYELTVEGQDKQRIIRIFQHSDLLRSMQDPIAKKDLQQLLNKMLEFFSSRKN